MAISLNSYSDYDPYNDRELKVRARSREEYEYLKEMQRRDREMQMYAMQNAAPPVVMDAPRAKPSHLNTKLLLTKGA